MPTPYAYFQKEIIPLADAKIGIMTHAFNYGTGIFEGIRGYWNAEQEQPVQQVQQVPQEQESGQPYRLQVHG